MMKIRKLVVITSLVLVAMLIATGVIFAQGRGAVNQGTDSTAEGDFSTVSGGRNNNIPGTGEFATISGGQDNSATGAHSTIGGGRGNTASGEGGFASSTGRATVGGGENNTAIGNHATIGGGIDNKAIGEASTVSGGGSFTDDANVPGNTAEGSFSIIGGGSGNTTSLLLSTIGGGLNNTASGFESVVGGGSRNTAGNLSSTVGGGSGNLASGFSSTVPGGDNNSAQGAFSFAAGRRAKANHGGTFVWADAVDPDFSEGEDFTSTENNQFLIRASGGVGIGTNSPNQLLTVGDSFASPLAGNRITIGNAGTSGPDGRSGLNLGEDLTQRAFILWHNDENYLQLGVKNGNIQENDAIVVKDRRVGVGTATPTQRLHVNGNVRANQFLTSSSQRWKTNIQPIEGALEKVQGLRGVSYDWKTNGKHDIGLIAEEVGKVIPEVVAYEENGKEATAVDYARLSPVLIEAIKEQQQLLEDRDAQITAQQQQIAALQARMTALEESVGVKGAQTGLLPFSTSAMWMMLAGGLGLVLVTPGLVLGYRRIRRDE